LDAFIQLMAGTIDAKSPYTGGHCQRVPVLTRMIAEAACAADTDPFREFSLNEEGWEALHIASWMHDCGKVTTPEYVVDKATKLETLYNRLHEIRTRFEVLRRDAEIQYWKQVAGGADETEERKKLEEEYRLLEADFEFVAVCNEGREFLTEQQKQRLRRIGERTWMRSFDDGLGLSVQEKQRKGESNPLHEPIKESLLRDAPEHLVKNRGEQYSAPGNPWGFQMKTPEHCYNFGELYNLSISRGTLTEEERFKINEHSVQTIIMLNGLPWPKHLREVPNIAGGHHERPDGTGYPRGLTRDQMPLEAHMMAVADIFEALTAPDRPYKQPKILSATLDILYGMAERNHIDLDILELFLQSGACQHYAAEYLRPEQLDITVEDYCAARSGGRTL